MRVSSGPDEPSDRRAHGRQAALEIDDAQHGFERGREDRLARPPAGLILATAELEQRAESEVRRRAREVRARDDLGAPGREHADGRIRVGVDQTLRHDERERGVAEERERLLVTRGRVLVGVRGVREGAIEEGRVAKPVAETGFEGRECQPRYLRKASVAFVPPNPKAFEMATSTSCLRAWFGT